jgi:pimeloyl-ACP methyl ester carboxylesterase
MTCSLIYLGGNGHCTARLGPAREALARQNSPFNLVDLPYSGFEDRPRARDFEQFLDHLSEFIAGVRGDRHLYGTGIGGLLALCLRARGEFLEIPLFLQAPVLWGLERRLMPRILRLGLARILLNRLFAAPWFRRRFVRKQFERPLSPGMQAAFFDGYRRCPAAADFFTWLTPGLLRELERRFGARPEALQNVGLWWGGKDRVVSLQELAWTERALGVRWPVRTFPDWGHYPMIDAPDEWVRALSDAVAAPERISGYGGPQTR